MVEKLNILLLEDNSEDTELINIELSKEDFLFRIKVVETEDNFLDALINFVPDIILADYTLPSYDGLSALLLTRERSPNLPFIFVSGTIGEEKAIEAMRNGATDYVIKENLSKLGSAVTRAIQERNEVRKSRVLAKALKEVADQWRTTFDAIDDAISLLSPQGEILRCNKAMEKFLKKSFHETIGSTCWELVHKTQEPIPECPVLRMRETRQRETMIMDDGEKTLQVIVDPILDENGDLFQIVHIISDITERIQEEKRLQESEERYRKLYNETPAMLHSTNIDGCLVSVSDFWLKKLGYERNEVIKKKFIDFLTEKSRQEAVEVNMPRFLKDGYINDIPYQFVKKNGEIINVLLSAISEKDSDGNIIRSMAVSIDMTDYKKLEAKFNQAQKMESVGRLAGGVAHDYNNALTVIMGYTELAMMDADPAGPLHADLNQVLKAGRRAQDITRQLLAFARKQTIAPIALNLNQTVESMIKMLRRLIGEDIYFVWLPGKNLWNVKMDPSQIDQILANLCVNSRDAIAGVGKIIIETDTVVFDAGYCADHAGFIPGAFVLMAITDNGCGMDKEILDDIFEPFFTTKAIDKGTGLGLATVYGIVKQNNGFINVYSEPGKGTSIKIYIPRHEGKAVESQEKNTAVIPQGHGETILLVEDDRTILKLGKKILNGLGYTVLTADTPKKAMNLAQEHTGEIHLLVTDVIMPEMNGRELSEQLQSLFPDLKCIFMSGYTANAIAHHGVLDEGVHFVQKPFSKKDLATIVRKVLDENNN